MSVMAGKYNFVSFQAIGIYAAAPLLRHSALIGVTKDAEYPGR
jgi:hypothetical protein